jgi:hypothetical protein
MGGLRRYLELTVKSKTGLSTEVVVCGMVAALCAAATGIFLIVGAFVWLADRYDPVIAALIMGSFFLLVGILAGIRALILHRRTVERAKLALAQRGTAPWLDLKMLPIAIQIGRTIGFGRIVTLIAAGLLAAGLARELAGRDKPKDGDEAGKDESAET